MRKVIILTVLQTIAFGCAMPKELEIQPAEFHATNPATRKKADPQMYCEKSKSGKGVCKRRIVNRL